jgi:rSAM/selenodomain-associated transferase 1
VDSPDGYTGKDTVLVFLKYPRPGRVKTRIARTTGEEQAALLYREMIEIVFAQLQEVRPHCRVVGYFDGQAEEEFLEWRPLADEWWQQPAGDLGARLAAGFATAHSTAQRVLAVGTDCLEIEPEIMRQAISTLTERDAVFGPAHDGGYYLVGTARHLDGFFTGIPWSSEETLRAHLELCRERGWSYGLLPSRHDIDTWEDWQAYRERNGATR